MRDLLDKIILPGFRNPISESPHDSAVCPCGTQRIAFTTDSYVVKPLFFPGGDLGSLAVHGTVNDLAMAGARPLYLSAAFVLEEGFELEQLRRIVDSMQKAAECAGVQIVTGDTKVVDKGKGDGLFINTAGLGLVEHGLNISPRSIRPGDAILVNGDLGQHGMAIMAMREGLQFESQIQSDSAPLAGLVLDLIAQGVQIHCLRDITRGGLTSITNELARDADVTMLLQEEHIAVREDVRAACEILGLDPFQVACEGRLAVILPDAGAERCIQLMKRHEVGQGACRIGAVLPRSTAPVLLKSKLGPTRILDMPNGEQLPRIC